MYNLRKECLQELLIGIYKTDRIKCMDGQILIEGRSLLDKCNFSNTQNYGNYNKWFEKMFELTFSESNTFFGIDTVGGSCKPDNPKKGQSRFQKENAIENAYDFLISKGINFEILSKDKFTNMKKCDKIIFEIIKIYLKKIFEFEDNTNSIDDTEVFINEAIPEIMKLLLGKTLKMGKHVHTTEDNSVVEFGMSKADCNRYISVGIDDLGIPKIVSFYTVKAQIQILKKKEPQKTLYDSNDEFRDLLIRDLCKYDPSEDIVCAYFPIPQPFEKDEYTLNSPERDFNISEVCPDYYETANFIIFYLFKMDKDKIGVFYPEVKTSYDLREAIIKKANEDLRIPFIKRIKKYYIDVIDYIEDIIKRILSIDTEKMISGEVDDRIVSAFNIDYDFILEYLDNNGVTSDKSLYLYMMIDRAINAFSIQIAHPERLAEQIVEYIDNNRIKEHIKRVENFISSEEIKKAIIIQENDENEAPEKYSLITDDMTWNQKQLQIYKKKTKGLFKDLKCRMETYLNCLRNTMQKK